METTTKKITIATIKAFIKNNAGNLFIKVNSSFDGMVDCVMPTDNKQFVRAEKAYHPCDNNLGIQGVWLVNGSRDSFTAYDDGVFQGIHVYNCCGSFIVATRKE